MKRLYEIEEDELGKEHQWHLNRRKWLQLALLGSAAMSLPWVTSCETNTNEDAPNLDGGGIFTHEEMKNIYTLQNFLLPEEGNGPSAAAMNAHQYFLWSLNDPHLPASEKDYFVGKSIQVFDLCKEQMDKNFYSLEDIEKENFLLKNMSEGWFESFISRMITVIFEATLLDPIYGGNTNENGWKWLEHTPGSPRPDNNTKYPEILSKIKPNIS
ncbi:gluconate 2-dehydrogenase subunit 3 family protein [Parvicella tangerina]|uniref:Gluconate 2-dehydrogenase subunit 3 family protein n=1 Tax=Parvicella tangerina TaxID=2829795 RepID=A0A916JK13_9FLAO|nr:gluconate 2-dehydrogenase subunit 3 family protein [Parvicella tangerina]CAG5078580.1 hypothetical protein CRYO30217_00713 [Parvicella tangerina]